MSLGAGGGSRFHGQLFLGQFLVFSVALWMLQGKEELLDSRARLCEGELQSYWTKKDFGDGFVDHFSKNIIVGVSY